LIANHYNKQPNTVAEPKEEERIYISNEDWGE
jgi:hypothetical protein